MAVPRIMLSSTCFDLMQIRENLESFIRNMGYETIRSDKGDIGYNITNTLKEDCSLAAQQCDILVGIIGGNFGSEATDNDSISMTEMKTALEHKKQIYLFVDTHVLTEKSTYNKNLEKNGEEFAKEKMSYEYVNDTRIFEFINDMYEHKSERVVIFDFKTSADISEILKKQWANLFQSFLSQKERDMQSSAYSKINSSADKLEGLMNLFENNIDNLKNSTNFMLDNIGYVKFISNPLIKHLKEKILKTNITIIFKNLDEFTKIMEMYGYSQVIDDSEYYSFSNQNYSQPYERISCHKSLFKDGKLIFPDTNKNMDEFLFVDNFSNNDINDINDDDLPF